MPGSMDLLPIYLAGTDPRAKLIACCEIAGEWMQHLGSPLTIEDGSPLAEVDDANRLAPPSFVAWNSIVNAIEALDAAASMVVKKGPDGEISLTLRPSSTFAMLRTAQMAASRAVWILAADDAENQSLRALETSRSEEVYYKTALTDMRNDGLRQQYGLSQLDAQIASSKSLIQKYDTSLKALRENWDKVTSETSIVKEAAAHLDADGSDVVLRHAFLLNWRTSSGNVHGYSWPSRVRGVALAGDEGARVAEIRGDAGQTLLSFQAITLLLATALQLFDDKRTRL